MARRRILFGVWTAGVVVVAAALVLLLAVPTRAWLAQRHTLADTTAELARLDAQNAELERRINDLSRPGEIERIAREDYSMVRPGEQAYAIQPAPALTPEALPQAWPYTLVGDILRVQG